MSLLETINELGTDKTELLFSETVDGELLQVRQYQTYRWLSAGGEMIQSLMDVEHPEKLLLPNLKAMLAVFEFIESPRTVLNLGAGAGSLERYLLANKPEIQITSVESIQAIINIAGRFFGMDPASFIIDSAEHYLTQNEQQYDVILVDIYAAEKQPSCLYEPEFHEKLGQACKARAVLAFNLLPESEADLLAVLQPLNEHVTTILMHEVPNHDNVVVYALTDKQLEMKTLLMHIERLASRGLHLQVISQNI